MATETAAYQDRIIQDPKIMVGKPVIKGTRVAVTTVLGHLAAGVTAESVAEEYRLTKEDVLACLGYALHVVESYEVRA